MAARSKLCCPLFAFYVYDSGHFLFLVAIRTTTTTAITGRTGEQPTPKLPALLGWRFWQHQPPPPPQQQQQQQQVSPVCPCHLPLAAAPPLGVSPLNESGALCGCVFSSVLLLFKNVFGLFSCDRSSIGCGIVINPGCFPQKFGASVPTIHPGPVVA